MAIDSKHADCIAVLGSDHSETCDSMESMANDLTNRAQGIDPRALVTMNQSGDLIMAIQNAKTEPTGAEGRTPGLAAMIRGTVFTGPSAPADPRAAPARRAAPAPVQRAAPTNNPNMTAQRQANFAQRGLSTSQASANIWRSIVYYAAG